MSRQPKDVVAALRKGCDAARGRLVTLQADDVLTILAELDRASAPAKPAAAPAKSDAAKSDAK